MKGSVAHEHVGVCWTERLTGLLARMHVEPDIRKTTQGHVTGCEWKLLAFKSITRPKEPINEKH